MFDPKQKRIGLFKQENKFSVYVSHFYWKDFQPLIVYETGIKIKKLYITGSKENQLLLSENTTMEIVVPYSWINEQILDRGYYPAEYNILLQSGISIYSDFFSTTFEVPEQLIIAFLHKMVPLTEHYTFKGCKGAELLQLLISHCGQMLLFENNSETIKFESVENVCQYLDRLDGEIQEYLKSDSNIQL
jgi:hypothetical protein